MLRNVHKAGDYYFGTRQAVVKGREIYIGFWWEDLKETDHLEDLGVDGRVILKWVFSN
jgi:hypothetical protein